MPAVSAMKQETEDDDDARLLDDAHGQPPSPESFFQRQFVVDVDRAPAAPRRDVIGNILSRDDSSWHRPASSATTSQSAEKAEPRQTTVEAQPSSKLVNESAAASSTALVTSPETGWRAISGSDVGGLWERPLAHALVSSPADAEPADVSLVAASPTVARTPRLTSDSGSRSGDPLATLMRLYGAVSDDGLVSSLDRQLHQPDNSPASITSLPVLPQLSMQGGTSVPVNNDDYIMREFNETEDNDDRPAKSYVCHVCQYIGKLYLCSVLTGVRGGDLGIPTEDKFIQNKNYSSLPWKAFKMCILYHQRCHFYPLLPPKSIK